jgi:hypothetical protein
LRHLLVDQAPAAERTAGQQHLGDRAAAAVKEPEPAKADAWSVWSCRREREPVQHDIGLAA